MNRIERRQLLANALRDGWFGDIVQKHADMRHAYGGKAHQRYLSNFKGGITFHLGSTTSGQFLRERTR